MKYWTLFIMVLALSSCTKEDEVTTDSTDNKSSGNVEVNASVNVNLEGDVIVGAPRAHSVVLSVAATNGVQVTVNYGTSATMLSQQTSGKVTANNIVEITLDNLEANTRYYYQILLNGVLRGGTYSFVTPRLQGSTFTFGVQGDSHPEREKEMFNADLYHINMNNVSQCQPDLYFTLGDDFSIESLIDKSMITQSSVDNIYSLQRKSLGMVGCNASLFLVNGNHEQAAKYLFDGTATNPAVCAGIARKRFYPLPDPSDGYSGDTSQVPYVGYLKDYYAFEWGDALFVTIDPYWHSDVPVDNVAGTMNKNTDPWASSYGDEQYQWLKKTLSESTAKYKFVFSHHVRGTGRGGVEDAVYYEWGGYNTKNVWQFDTYRPGWEMPIHQLFVKYGVTIFFQGHDHVFCKQDLDGVIYQSCPNPADNTYRAFNADAYKSGDVLPNSGFLKVTVSPSEVVVNYIRAFLPGDGDNASVAYSYTIKAK